MKDCISNKAHGTRHGQKTAVFGGFPAFRGARTFFRLAIFAFILSANNCEVFMLSMSDYIDEATGTAMGLDYSFETSSHKMDTGTVAIPVGETTTITVAMRNPRSFDLELALEGEGNEKAFVSLNPDKQTATVTIENPAHLSRFDLTLTTSYEGRPMPEYKLPVMEARYFDTTLASLSVTADYFSKDMLTSSDYNFPIPPTTGKDIQVTAAVPAGKHSSYTIDNQTKTTGTTTLNGINVGNKITITVTADCGDTQVYTIETVSAKLSGLSAVYSGGSITNSTALNSLKSSLTVTAAFAEGFSITLNTTDYTLTTNNTDKEKVTTGTNTITVSVSFGELTATFNVTVTNPGNGTSGSPFEIRTVDELLKVGTGADGWSLSVSYKLAVDLDLSGVTRSPIGTGTGAGSNFTGTFDGNGHVIRNLANRSTSDYIGLFGCIGGGGTVKNLGLIDVNITNNTAPYTGGVVGRNYGTVQNCFVTGTVQSNGDLVGGVVGQHAGGTVTNCFALNTSVNGSTNVGRVMGNNTYPGGNNFASSKMTVSGKTFTSNAFTATQQGIDITPGNVETSQILLNGIFNSNAPDLSACLYKLGDIGQGGGKIFYVAGTSGFRLEGYGSDGEPEYFPTIGAAYYLEAAPADLGTFIWGGGGSIELHYSGLGQTPEIANKIGRGRLNTARIHYHSINTPAATACFNHDAGGVTDWFLPSTEELQFLYNNRAYVGNLSTGNYWSSYTNAMNTALRINFSDGVSLNPNRDALYSVRAIRAF